MEQDEKLTDEMCVCGHLKSDHGSKVVRIDNNAILRIPNVGSCCCENCCCARFCWKSWCKLSEVK